MKRTKIKYDNDDEGSAEELHQTQGVVPVEPLRIPLILERFMDQYVPAPDELHATDVVGLSALRSELACWMPFGCKEDPLQGYVSTLALNGFTMQSTSSGPALCLIRKSQLIKTEPYTEVEELCK